MRIRPFRYNLSPEISVVEYASTFFCFLILILVIITGNFECSSCNMGYLNPVLQSSSQVHAEYGPVSGGGLRFLPFLPSFFIILCLDLEFPRLLFFFFFVFALQVTPYSISLWLNSIHVFWSSRLRPILLIYSFFIVI